VVKAEVMLGSIIERKATLDLLGSIHGTRYFSQRLRMKNSGIPQLIYLMEGDELNLGVDERNKLHSAELETRIWYGFSVIRTKNLDDTIAKLCHLHKQISQRAFPHTSKRKDNVSDFKTMKKASYHDQIEPSLGHRCAIVFRTDPVPSFGMERFLTYEEFHTKLECDIEVGTRSIGSIHQAMLMQVKSLSTVKCQAVSNLYSTANQFLQYYNDLSSVQNIETQKLIASNILLEDKNMSIRTKGTIGPCSSTQLFVAYAITNPNENNYRSSTRKYDDTNVLSFDEVVPFRNSQAQHVVNNHYATSLTNTNDCGGKGEARKESGTTIKCNVVNASNFQTASQTAIPIFFESYAPSKTVLISTESKAICTPKNNDATTCINSASLFSKRNVKNNSMQQTSNTGPKQQLYQNPHITPTPTGKYGLSSSLCYYDLTDNSPDDIQVPFTPNRVDIDLTF
jgi:ERCC4 domain